LLKQRFEWQNIALEKIRARTIATLPKREPRNGEPHPLQGFARPLPAGDLKKSLNT
jgi:hypothetical protein